VNEEKLKKLGMWMIVLAFILLIMLSNLLLPNHDAAEAVGSLFGILIILYAAMKVYTRNKDEYLKSKAIFVIGILAILWTLSVIIKELIEQRNLQGTVKNVESLITGNTSNIIPQNQSTNVKVPGYSDSQTDIATKVLNQLVEVGIPYAKRTEENYRQVALISESGILDSKIYTSKSYLEQSQRSLVRLSQLVSEQKIIFEEMILAQEKAITNMKVDDNFKSKALAGLKKGESENRTLLDAQLKVSRQVINNIQTILNLASSNFGKTKVIQNTVDFGNQADNQIYLNTFNELQNAIKEEAKYLELRQALQNKNLQKLKELAN
jgi:hypothetical protein